MMPADQVLELIQMGKLVRKCQFTNQILTVEPATPLKNALPKAVQRRVTALLALEFAVFVSML